MTTVPAAASSRPWRRLEVAVVDDAPEAGARLRVGAVEGADLGAELVDERVADLAVDQDVVGRDAGLAGVEELAPGDAAGGDVEVGAGVHVGRATCRPARGRSA